MNLFRFKRGWNIFNILDSFDNLILREDVERRAAERENERTIVKLQASRLPPTYADPIVACTSRRCIGGVQQGMHDELVGRFIARLEMQLELRTMKAEEDALKITKQVKRMYEAEVRSYWEAWSTAPQESPRELFCTALEELVMVNAVVVSAVSLLLFVYQYLIGHIDKGGTLTCSSGSFQFRATFTSIVLFEGAYVWIKFRDVTSSSGTNSTRGGGYRRPLKNKLTGATKLSKPEARYTPPGQSGNHIYLGVCATDEEAQIKKQIAACDYGKGVDQLELGHGIYFQISSRLSEQEQGLSVLEKRRRVPHKVKQVYSEYIKEVDIVHQIGAFYRGEGEGRLDLPHGKLFSIPLMSLGDAECFTAVEKESLIESKVREAYEGFRKERTHLNQLIDPSQVETNGRVDGPSTGASSSRDHHDLDPHPQQESDVEATLMVMLTDLQNMVTHRDQMLQERWQMLQQGEQRFQAIKLTNSELQQVVKVKDQSYQECLQENEALQRMLEEKDRRISELELEERIREARNNKMLLN